MAKEPVIMSNGSAERYAYGACSVISVILLSRNNDQLDLHNIAGQTEGRQASLHTKHIYITCQLQTISLNSILY